MSSSAADATSIGLQRDVPLAEMTTLGVGGSADWFMEVDDLTQLEQACLWAADKQIPILYSGDASNVLFPDRNFPGLVLKNRIMGRERSGEEVEVAGGENLGEVICWLNGLNLSGMERMYGIPGTIAGALVGNAGAYGQQIGDSVIEVTVWWENRIQVVSTSDLEFRYRHSLFKKYKEAFVLRCRLLLSRSAEQLQEVSDEILAKRLLKYPIGLRSPGSFFKNVSLDEISKTALEKVPDDFIMFGKIPAGRLLEAVGANGVRQGDAQIAEHHGNLIMNVGRATAGDILTLAEHYASQVFEQFHIRLEPEILIVGDSPLKQVNATGGGGE